LASFFGIYFIANNHFHITRLLLGLFSYVQWMKQARLTYNGLCCSAVEIQNKKLSYRLETGRQQRISL